MVIFLDIAPDSYLFDIENFKKLLLYSLNRTYKSIIPVEFSGMKHYSFEKCSSPNSLSSEAFVNKYKHWDISISRLFAEAFSIIINFGKKWE